ncbi:BPSS1780 family membrane protein [Neolewinella persica]|uniref:BPSS1780 family membrane protein n=1 Tax=Neolewinella persica TaxID=70998 RepID=UPI000372F47C|nr:BPSS1780 family membrane protein [Neolewinella persica]
MTRYPEQVDLAINKSYAFNFGDYISRGFSLIGKNPGLFIGYAFVYMLIVMVCQIIPILGPIASFVVTPCLTAGFYLAAHKQEEGQTLEFGDFFKGFDFIGQLILISLIQAGLLLLTMIPIGAMMFFTLDVTSGDDFPILTVALALLLFLPIVYIMVAWSFAPFLVLFHKMEAWPAMEASRKIISSNWAMFFLFYIVAGFITMLGLIALGFGILYTLPAVMCMYYAAFRDIVGVPGAHSEGSFMDHLVD